MPPRPQPNETPKHPNHIEQVREDVGAVIAHEKASKQLSSELQQAKEKMIDFLKDGHIDEALKIKEKLNVSEEFSQEVAKEGMIRLLEDRHIDTALKIKEKLNVSEEASQEFAKEGMVYLLKYEHIDEALEIKEKLNVSEEASQEVAKERMIYHLKYGHIDEALEVKEKFGVSDIDFKEDWRLLLDFNIVISKAEPLFGKERFPQIPVDAKNKFFASELATLYAKEPKTQITEDDLLQARISAFESGDTLEVEDQEAFEELSQYFTTEAIARFIGTRDRNYFHIAAQNIISLYQASGLESKVFAGNILHQVSMDTASYDNQDSYDYLNSIGEDVIIIKENLNPIKDILQSEEDLESQNLLEKIEHGGMYTSWKELRNIYEIAHNIEVYEKIKTLPAEKKSFFKTLFLHPNISTSAVTSFLENPRDFLDLDDEHTPDDVQERKKPSNYTHFEHLDLTAEDLRDGLVDGTLDQLQYFPEYEVNYEFCNTTQSDLIGYIYQAVGKRSEKISGKARNVKQTFTALNALLKSYEVSLKDILADSRKITAELQNEIEEIIFDPENGLTDKRQKQVYRARVHRKSSPEALVAGNDTNCCMPFGSGKQNVYMYNLGCAQMTLERKMSNGKYRTVAQSVITPDVNVGNNVAEIINNLAGSRDNIWNTIQNDLSKQQEIFVTADNIEVNKNFDDSDKLLKKLYADFFCRYIAELHTHNPHINKDELIIGKGYTDMDGFDDKENTYVPIIPPGYSDNTDKKSYCLNLKQTDKITAKIHTAGPTQITNPQESTEGERFSQGIRPLTARDAIRVAYMEGKVYADNESLMQYLHRIGNELIAKDINNTMKNRKNLSLIAEDKDGNALGYIVAYVGVSREGQEHVYVADLAAGENKIAGGKLMRDFIGLVQKHYPKWPIVAEARESTSYAIVQNKAEKLGYSVHELGEYSQSNDTMHNIVLVPHGVELTGFDFRNDEESADEDYYDDEEE